MNYLTDKNTRGYSEQQLKELNARLEKRMEKFDPKSPFYEGELRWQAEQLLIDYWQGR